MNKKNRLFLGSKEAGQRSAVIYTLIENCRRHGVELYTYLKDVLERMPTTTTQEIGQLTPLNWKKARQLHVNLAA
jgi:transposase